MSFVTTNPEALAAAAAKLEGIGSALAAQNSAAAMTTSAVAPAAADEVSALQATQFSAYGTLYQQLSAQATEIHQMFVNTLSASSNSYGETEAANAAAGAAADTSALDMSVMQVSNFGSAASDLLQLGSAGFLAPKSLQGGTAALPGGLSALPGGAAVHPLAVPAAGLGVAPASAGVGQAASIGRLSVPASWAGMAATTPTTAPTPLTGASWAAATPHSAPVTALPAGMGSVAGTGRGGYGLGTPRYGVKPIVAPRPAVV